MKRNRALGPVAAFLVPFSVYTYCLCPTIGAGDTIELINCAAILGIPHAPGYPLFTMLGHLFTWLPFNSLAWRVNLSSAVFCALTCLFVYLSLFRLTRQVWPSLTGAWALAFSRFFWHYAEVAEVFALNNLFVALITYVLVLSGQTAVRANPGASELRPSCLCPRVRRLFWTFCLLSGLALTNHHTIVLLAPGALLFLCLSPSTSKLFRDGKTVASGVLLFLAGLLPYAYCPLAAAAKPPINWGNPVTLEGLVRLVFRMDFGTFSLSSVTAPTSPLLQLPVFLRSFYHQFTPLGIALAILGLWEIKRRGFIQAFFSAGFFFGGAFFVVFANYPFQDPLRLGVLQRFYIMPAVIMSFWIGLGAHHVRVWLNKKSDRRIVSLLIFMFLGGGLVAWEVATNVNEANFRDNYMAEDFAHNLLMCLAKDSLFFVQGDVASMGIDYFQTVLHERTDVISLDQEKLTYPWYYEQAKKRFPAIVLRGKRYDGTNTLNLHFIADNDGTHPVFFRFFKEESYKKAFRPVRMGLVQLMIPKNQTYPLWQIEENVNRLFSSFKKRGWQRDYPPTGFEQVLKSYYARPFAALGDQCYQAGELSKAEAYYQRALQIEPHHASALKGLAVLYINKLNRPAEAARLLTRYLELNPDDEEAGVLREIIQTYGK
jgi:tetratricopeptide (TPR) repeat protein